MSCYEWESGRIKLPSKEYGRVKKEMIQAHKSYQEKQYKNALELYEKMIAAGKGKRNVDWNEIYIKCRSTRIKDYSCCFVDLHTENCLDPEFKMQPRENKKPLKPKKKDYITKGNRKDYAIYFEDAEILFIDQKKIVVWVVNENNHAREHAASHELGKAFFKILNSVKWTSRSGGVIVGNDEYNQDDRGIGGGGNYVTMSFGQKKKNTKCLPNNRSIIPGSVDDVLSRY